MKYDESTTSLISLALAGESGTSAQAIAQTGVALTALLIEKNMAYGDSARQPIAVFARDIDVRTRLGVRMDDKISRLTRGDNTTFGEDAIVDLAGYLVLYLSLDLEQPCPTCAGPIRETVGMVCQTCGTDYGETT